MKKQTASNDALPKRKSVAQPPAKPVCSAGSMAVQERAARLEAELASMGQSWRPSVPMPAAISSPDSDRSERIATNKSESNIATAAYTLLRALRSPRNVAQLVGVSEKQVRSWIAADPLERFDPRNYEAEAGEIESALLRDRLAILVQAREARKNASGKVFSELPSDLSLALLREEVRHIARQNEILSHPAARLAAVDFKDGCGKGASAR